MASKRKASTKGKSQSKRVVTEIAPGVRTMLDAYMQSYNEGPERVSSPLKYTDVINLALDGFLPGRPEPELADEPSDPPPAADGSPSAELNPEA